MGEAGLLQVLSNEVNRSILGVLAVEPNYPRRIGTLLSLAESEVARRLRLLEGLGLVSSEWTNIGRNVKLYRLQVEEVSLRFSAAGVDVGVVAAGRSGVVARAQPVPEEAPPAAAFAGRTGELQALAGPHRVVIVAGMAGIGKTSLLARFAAQAEATQPVFWQGFRGVESLNWLANRLSLFFAKQGDRRLHDALQRDVDTPDRLALMLAALRDNKAVLVFDDAHRATEADAALGEFLLAAIEDPGASRLVLAGRAPPRHRPAPHVANVELAGLDLDGVAALMALKGLEEGPKVVAQVRDATGGHPLALNLLLEAARERRLPLAQVLPSLPPTGLEDYLLREVDSVLSDEERRVLTLASVFRTSFTAEELSALSSRSAETVLRRLRGRHLVDGTEDGHALHEVLRSYFYKQAADKPRLHARAAERYLERGTIEGRLEAMHHYLLAERPDEVLELLDEDLDLDDFDLIDTGYHNLYSTVLSRFTRENVLVPRRWGLIEDERGDIAFSRGDDAAALQHYAEALTVFTKEKDSARIADLHWKRSRALERTGQLDDARAAVQAGLAAGCTEQVALERLRVLEKRLAA